MKTPLNSTCSKGRVNLRSKTHMLGTTFEMDEVPFGVETAVGDNHSFHRILLETIDGADLVADRKRNADG
jgi:hypothetical protein